MCHDIINNENTKELKINKTHSSSFSTLRIFHTPHFPHSAFSTLRIFHTPHSALRTPHNPPNRNVSSNKLKSIIPDKQKQGAFLISLRLRVMLVMWPRGPVDKASDYESGDSRLESWRGRLFFLREKKKYSLK